MNQARDHRHRLLSAAVVLAAVGTGQVARGQADDVEEPAADVLQQPQAVVMFNDNNCDQWSVGGRNLTTIKGRIESSLALQIEDLERKCGLSPAQVRKLRLAGEGDIKRYTDRVEEQRRKFQLIKNDA